MALLVALILAAGPARAAESLPERIDREVIEPALKLIRDAALELADPDSSASLLAPTPLLVPASPPAKKLISWVDVHFVSQHAKAARQLADPRVMTPAMGDDSDEEDENVKEELPEPKDEPPQDPQPPSLSTATLKRNPN